MTNIRISEELTNLIKGMKKAYAKRTGNFVSYEKIIERAIEEYDMDDFDQDEYDDQEDDDNE